MIERKGHKPAAKPYPWLSAVVGAGMPDVSMLDPGYTCTAAPLPVPDWGELERLTPCGPAAVAAILRRMRPDAPEPVPVPERPPRSDVERQVAYVGRLRGLGRCRSCRGAVEETRCGAYLCADCAATAEATSRAIHADRRASGLCFRCGRLPRIEDRRQCGPCIARIAETVRRSRARAKLCSICGKRPPSKWRGICDVCCVAARARAIAAGEAPQPCA